MRAWLVETLGDPTDALRLRDVPEPMPGPGTVRVRVEAAALNFFDILLCQGRYQERPPLPFTPGAEVAGTVEAVGPDVGDWPRAGDRVVARPQLPHGGLAEQVVVPASAVYPIPPAMPAEEAAAAFITYQTAYYALRERIGLRAGETVLVHAGAGGVGSAAIQLARAAGARVAATAGGREKVAVARRMGAEEVVDYLAEDFGPRVQAWTGGRGVDVVVDPVGGDVFDRSRRIVAFGGRILVIGFASGRIPEIPANHVLLKNYAVVGVHWGLFERRDPEGVRRIHDRLTTLYQEGAIRPLIGARYPLEEVVEALEALYSRRTVGKVVVAP
jgi:NADPH2:quinone reductase